MPGLDWVLEVNFVEIGSDHGVTLLTVIFFLFLILIAESFIFEGMRFVS